MREFTEPLQGPLMLGYAAHYGLGLFRPCSVQRVQTLAGGAVLLNEM
jgi:hypothetical protein